MEMKPYNSLYFTLTLIASTFVIIVIIKSIFPIWEIFHIAIMLSIYSSLIIIRKCRLERARLVYSLLFVVIVVLPIFMGKTINNFVDQTVCLIRGSGNFQSLLLLHTNDKVYICGYLEECSSTKFGANQHTWEACKISDPRNRTHVVLMYIYDITMNLDNQFVFTSLANYGRNTLIVESAKIVSSSKSMPCEFGRDCELVLDPILMEVVMQ